MLCFRKRRQITDIAIDIWKAYFPIQIAQHSPTITFKEDDGSDYTVLHISHALGMGLDPDHIRNTAKRVLTLRTACGGTLTAHVYPVRARIEDHFDGWAEWDAEFAFYEGPTGESLAGHVGFLQFFDPLHRGRHVFLEPRLPKSSVPGSYFEYECSDAIPNITLPQPAH